MKNILYLSLFIIILLPVVSCKSKKSTTTSSSNATKEQNTTTLTNSTATQSTNPPFINSITPNFGPVGTKISFSGTGLSRDGISGIDFYQESPYASYGVATYIDATPLSFTIPSVLMTADAVPRSLPVNPGTYKIVVTKSASLRTKSNVITFTVTGDQITVPVINSITPSSGPVGTQITLSGTGFSQRNIITIRKIVSPLGLSSKHNLTVSLDNNGNFSFVIPANIATITEIMTGTPPGATVPGIYQILVDNGIISSAPVDFIVTPSTAPVNNPTTSSKDGASARFVVSFYSIGEGIDGKTNDEFLNFLNSYPKNLVYTRTYWGREGERDYCLALNELSSSEQTDFIKKANAILGKSKLINVKENAKHNRAGGHAPADTISTENTYRLVISFYSVGEGSDYKTKEEFEKFLNNYTKKIAYEPTQWGREGEVDYCLKLNELSSTEQMNFIKKAKELLSKSRLVHVNENTKCVNKH